jgi:hypothetical protein
MPHRFYILMLNVNPGLTVGDVQSTLSSRQIDWCRIANNAWLIHTNHAMKHLNGTIIPLASPSGSYYLARVSVSDNEGMLAPEVGPWIAARRRPGD